MKVDRYRPFARSGVKRSEHIAISAQLRKMYPGNIFRSVEYRADKDNIYVRHFKVKDGPLTFDRATLKPRQELPVLSELHWKQAVKFIEGLDTSSPDNVDWLLDQQDTEERKAVQDAINAKFEAFLD